MPSTHMLRATIRIILYSLSAVMPLFFLPFTLDALELNKHFLLSIVVLVALLLWLLDGALSRQFKIRRTPFDVPVLLYLGTVMLSGIFSIDRFISFIGDYNNIQIAVLPLIFLVALFFLITQMFDTDASRFRLLASSALGGTVACIWFILDKAGWFSFSLFGVRISNTVSLSNAEFGVYLILLIVGCVSLLSMKKKGYVIDAIAGIIGLLSLVVLFSLGFKVVYIIFVIGLAMLLALMLTYVDFLRIKWITVSFALVVLAVIFIFLQIPQVFNFALPTEISLGVQTSYTIAWKTITDTTKQFLLGSGPGTFVYDFSHYKPDSLNLNNFVWRIRFSKPYASFVSQLAELGILGVISFMLLALITLGFIGSQWIASMSPKERTSAQFSQKNAFMFLVSPLWLILLISMFFIQISMSLWYVFFVLLALLSATSVQGGKEKEIMISLKSSPPYVLATSFSVVLLFAGGLVYGVFAGRYYVAEIKHTQAKKSTENPAEQITYLSEATQLNRKSSRYRVALAEAYLNEARVVSNQADGSPELITRLVASAVNEARIATDLSPQNVNTWETLANMYRNAQPFAPGVQPWVTSSYAQAVLFEPGNPALHLQLANAKYLEGKKTEAKESYEMAVSLKQDYLDAYLQLAGYYEQEKDLDRAISELEKGLQVGRQSDNYIFQLGRLFFNRNKEGDWDKALSLFNAAISINPNNANALFSAGLVFDRKGEKEQALRYFDEVLKRDPKNEAVASRAKQLRSILGIR